MANVIPTENVFCNDPLTYEEILNWRGFSFETSRLRTHKAQRKAFAASLVDGGVLDEGRYGIAESDNIINNVVQLANEIHNGTFWLYKENN